MRRPLLLALVLALLLPGCVNDGTTATGTVDERDAAGPLAIGEPVVQDHDHSDPALHNGSQGFRLVAHVKPWGDGSEYGMGTVNEFAINGQHAFVSRSNPEGGFAIVDLSDLERPRVVGDFRSEGGADVEVTSDGQYALLMTQRTMPGEQSTDNPSARAPRGIYVVDVRDKSDPTLSSFLPLPHNGPHTAHYHYAGPGQEIVAVQTYDFVPNPATGSIDPLLPATQRIVLMELVRTEEGARLETRSTYAVTDLPQGAAQYFPHDAFIETHPETGQRLMYVAYWDAGLRVVDITDLSQPREIARFDDVAPSALVQLHDARTFPVPVQGRHVTVIAPEIVTAPEAGQMTFVDTTDPTQPVKLGWWSVPGNLTVDQPFLFSPHVLDTHPSGRVVIGHNHAGVWLVDASDPANATTLAYYFPHEERPGWTGPTPSVWGARFHRDHVIATDGPSGLYVLAPDEGLLPRAAPGRVPA